MPQKSNLSVDCQPDPIASMKVMAVDIMMCSQLAHGQSPALRPVVLKTHGVAGGAQSERDCGVCPRFNLAVFLLHGT
jgi:hypothetical protein